MVCAIVIDVGYWWANAKKTQIAADACALAAARELPRPDPSDWDPPLTQCMFEGVDYAKTNLPLEGLANEPRHLGTAVKSPYAAESGGDPKRFVEAKVTIAVGTFFGRIINKDYLTITRRAVAEKLEGTTKLAIFAGSTSCDAQKGLYFDGEPINVVGQVHSNGEYTVNSQQPPNHFTATSGTIAKENCVANVTYPGPPASSASAEYTSAPGEWLPRDGEELQWPDWWYPADFGWYLPEQKPAVPGRCTYQGQQIEVTDTQLKITGKPDQLLLPHPDPLKVGWDIVPEGTYCATESFKVTGEKHEGRITVLSRIIQIGGKGQKYEPYANNMLFFTIPNSDIDPGNDGPYTLGNFNPPELPPYEPCYLSPAPNTELDGEDYTWGGIIFNPCGKVHLNNKTSSVGTPQLVGTIYGFQVHINGDDFKMQGTQDLNESVGAALVE